MDLKTGDRVKFLNDVGGGVLTAFLDKKRAMVRTSDGFEIPVMIAELVPDSGNFLPIEKPAEPEKQPEIKSPQKKNPLPAEVKIQSTDEEICFAILPKPQSTDLFAYMINNSSYTIHYVIATRGEEEETLLFDQGSMDSRTQMKIRKFLPDNLNHIIRFDVQLLFYKENFFIAREPVSLAVFMNPGEVYSGKALTENDYFDRKALVFSISNFNRQSPYAHSGGLDVSDLLKEGFNKDKPAPVSREEKKTKNEPEEVDLHIEAITDNFSGLSNSEIIDVQMSRFKIALDTAVIHKTRRIVFILSVKPLMTSTPIYNTRMPALRNTAMVLQW
jgi:hypothetical protein